MTTNSTDAFPGDDKADKFFGVSYSLYGIAMALFLGRMYARLTPGWRNLQADDYTMIVCVICITFSQAIATVAVQTGFGEHAQFLPPDSLEEIIRLNVISGISWTWGITFLKISVTFMLLRITIDRFWQYGLYFAMLVIMATGVAATVLQVIMCDPLSALWDASISLDHCWSQKTMAQNVYIGSVVFAVTDVIYSILPINVVRKIKRPLREKILLCCLMGIGLAASAAAIRKMVMAKQKYVSEVDFTWYMIDFTLWALIESHIGIVAGCVPCLRSPVEKLLHRASISRSRSSRQCRTSGPFKDSFGARSFTVTTCARGSGRVQPGGQSEECMLNGASKEQAGPSELLNSVQEPPKIFQKTDIYQTIEKVNEGEV